MSHPAQRDGALGEHLLFFQVVQCRLQLDLAMLFFAVGNNFYVALGFFWPLCSADQVCGALLSEALNEASRRSR